LAALYEYECRKRGSQRLAYPPVFASGIHANTLHYVANDDIMQYSFPIVMSCDECVSCRVVRVVLPMVQTAWACRDGQMVLVDAGGEYNMFSSDITRTWPVNGKFIPAQLDLYNTVLDVQKKCIEVWVRHGGRLVINYLLSIIINYQILLHISTDRCSLPRSCACPMGA
jgi:Xaa-Pro aminopeptidase